MSEEDFGPVDGLEIVRVLLVIACGVMFYYALRAYGF